VIQTTQKYIEAFCEDEAPTVSIDWVELTVGVIPLGDGAHGAFSVCPDKFDETEMRTLVRCEIERYGTIPGDDYTIIERMLFSVRLLVTAVKGCISFGV
jgi:hypothetical protein